MSLISRGSRSPSCTSSRGRSLSPCPSQLPSHPQSRSLSRCVDPPKDHQEEHVSSGIVDAVGWIQEYGSLPSAPSESHKIHSFKAALDAENHPSSSYRLPISDSSSDILLDLEDRILSATSWMRPKRVSKLIPYPGMHSHKYYHFEGRSCPGPVLCPVPSQSLGA